MFNNLTDDELFTISKAFSLLRQAFLECEFKDIDGYLKYARKIRALDECEIGILRHRLSRVNSIEVGVRSLLSFLNSSPEEKLGFVRYVR